MSSDDQIAVVLYEGCWFVSHVSGGNYHLAVKNSRAYKNKKQALSAALLFPKTEYGICIYDRISTAQIDENFN